MVASLRHTHEFGNGKRHGFHDMKSSERLI